MQYFTIFFFWLFSVDFQNHITYINKLKKFYLRTGGGRGGGYAVLNIVLWGAVLYTLVPVLGEVARTLVLRGVWSRDKTLLKGLLSTFYPDFYQRKNGSLNFWLYFCKSGVCCFYILKNLDIYRIVVLGLIRIWYSLLFKWCPKIFGYLL